MNDSVPIARMEISLIDDPECGVSVAVFVAGCSRRCVGCQNPDLWYADKFEPHPVEGVKEELDRFVTESKGMIDSVVFVGGDWMMYQPQYCELAKWAQSRGLRTVLYTGENFEMLPEYVRRVSDWVIDGAWRRDLPGVFPPSTNQRVFHQGELVDPEGLPLYQHLSAQVK